MNIGICIIHLYIPGSRNLKNKRQVIKSLKDRIRLNFNVSIAEIDNLDVWQKSSLGIVSISNDKKYIHTLFHKVIALIGENKSITVIDYSIEMI